MTNHSAIESLYGLGFEPSSVVIWSLLGARSLKKRFRCIRSLTRLPYSPPRDPGRPPVTPVAPGAHRALLTPPRARRVGSSTFTAMGMASALWQPTMMRSRSCRNRLGLMGLVKMSAMFVSPGSL